MIDTDAIETRIKWLNSSITDTLAWGLDDNTCPSLLRHCNATIDALTNELAITRRELKLAIDLNKRVSQC